MEPQWIARRRGARASFAKTVEKHFGALLGMSPETGQHFVQQMSSCRHEIRCAREEFFRHRPAQLNAKPPPAFINDIARKHARPVARPQPQGARRHPELESAV